MIMKNLIRLLTLPMMVLFLFASCTKEGPQGPAGTDGIDGVDGTNGTNGEDGTAGCVECHTSNEDMMLKSMQWENSGHASGTSWARGSSTSCAECHSSQGFQQVAKGETVTGHTMPLPANCYICHKIHETHTTSDWALRVTDDVTFIQGGATYSASNTNANTCIQCHQSRSVDNIDPSSTEDYVITSYRFGPHHGPQGNMIAGAGKSGAVEFTSATYSNHAHANADCVSCHMAEGDLHMGGHTNTLAMRDDTGHLTDLNIKGCVSCHDGMDEAALIAKTEAAHTSNYALFNQLQDALLALNYIDASGYVVGDDNTNRVGSSNPRTVSHAHAGAIYNYKFIKEDLSMMVHNPKYARALVNEALNALN
jgi:hypothetical protein